MNRLPLLFILILTLLSPMVMAEGAGGIESFQVVGQDLLPGAGKLELLSSTGIVSTIGGLGYGVDEDGFVVGGFGMAVTSKGNPATYGGYGGTIQGWQHRWGPLVGLFTTRVGFGGIYRDHHAGLSLLGMAGAQMGVRLMPWFVLGVEGGLAGTITWTKGNSLSLAYAPTVGVRLLWGAF